LLAVTGIPACIIGLAPALKWGLSHQWANFTFALQLGQYQALNPIVKKYYPDRLSLFKAQVYLYQRFVAPRVISGALPGESSFLATIHVLALSLGLCCLVVSVFLFVLSLFWRHPHLIQIRQLVALPLLFTCCGISLILHFYSCRNWPDLLST